MEQVVRVLFSCAGSSRSRGEERAGESSRRETAGWSVLASTRVTERSEDEKHIGSRREESTITNTGSMCDASHIRSLFYHVKGASPEGGGQACRISSSFLTSLNERFRPHLASLLPYMRPLLTSVSSTSCTSSSWYLVSACYQALGLARGTPPRRKRRASGAKLPLFAAL